MDYKSPSVQAYIFNINRIILEFVVELLLLGKLVFYCFYCERYAIVTIVLSSNIDTGVLHRIELTDRFFYFKLF